ncbi:deoxyribonuclease-1-like isoform X2 [Eucyclogobius newberryi]|uniref:deoxyribonuclease-1-like isoform X2 n=1 Tax=Eucyclogobius newberryi TaxID=166745 RepID=UPI003B5BD303
MSRSSTALPSLLLILVLFLSGLDCFKICSYNIPKFNKAKTSNYRIIHTLTRVFSRCDISLLLHVQDLTAVQKLLASLNRYSKNTKYESVSSGALGNDPQNMQYYTFIYRTQTVSLTGQHQYQSTFVRPPFAVRFQSNKTLASEFVLIPLHSEPSKAVQEMDKLYDVFLEVVKKWNNKNVMFLGNFHAGCAYMTRADKMKIRLFSNTSFSWLISDRTDTTVTDKTHCAYDRMVVHGESFLKQVKPFSAQVFNPIKSFKMRSSKLVEVSDHFPLEVELKSFGISLLQAKSLYILLLSLYFLLDP